MPLYKLAELSGEEMDKDKSLDVFNYKDCFLLFTFHLHNKTFTQATLFSGEANNLEIRGKQSLLIYWRTGSLTAERSAWD